MRNETAPISLYAPKTILNQNITGSRRFAAQEWPIERIRGIGKATGTTINDVVLAMCSGALRHYLIELDALPSQTLVAMVPVSLKLDEAGEASTTGGNAVGTHHGQAAHRRARRRRAPRRHPRSVMSGKEACASHVARRRSSR